MKYHAGSGRAKARRRLKPAPLLLLLTVVLAGCSKYSRTPPIQVFPDMKDQPKYLPQGESAFFSDARELRAPVPGAVARNQEDEQPQPPLTMALLERGQERFNIYCAPCHDRTGSGRGMVATRAAWLAANLTEDRIRQMPDRQIFDTISNGVRTMPAYRYQVAENDRWAIVAYVRALERAAAGTVADVPAELRSDLR
jgi:mono/diheme cytochrome c family protein